MAEAGHTPRPASRSRTAAPSPTVASALLPAVVVALAWWSGPALAQYKWVGPDGRINYGDRPPQAAMVERPVDATTERPVDATTTSSSHPSAGVDRRGDSGVTSTNAALPYELRLAAQRHPVTLYTTPDCQPCALARSHLLKRGIPFSTREVRTQEDAAAFSALGFAALTFPALAVGTDRASGFEAGHWDRLLDAAAYPKTSRLPPRWQAPRAEALAPPVKPAPLGALAAPEQGAGTTAATQEAASGAGIEDTANADTRRSRASAPEQPAIRF